jgi:hypothetical protein
VEVNGETTSVLFRLDPTHDRFLLDHLQYGRPLLPGVMGLELLAQAAIASGACQQVAEVRNFVIERPVAFPTDEVRQIRVAIVGGAASLQTRAYTRAAQGHETSEEREHFRATLVDRVTEPLTASLTEPPFPYYPTSYREDSPLRHGPSLRSLGGLFLDRSGGWARLTALAEDVAAQPRGASGWTIPIALLDGCFMACGIYSYVMCGQRVEMPIGLGRLRLASRARTGEACTAQLYFRRQDAKISTYDLILFGADGRAIFALDDLQLAIMASDRNRPT